MKTIALLLTLALTGCKTRADEPPPAAAPARTAADADRIEVLARHRPIAGKEDLDSDPVVVHFDRFAVTKAHFDPQHLEGGTATLTLDFTSIKTGSDERDKDLQSPDYIDVAKFATATIDVANVKQAGAKYTADAAVAFRGITKTYPITFEVLATTADSVRIKGEHGFSRLDFAVGIDPATDPTERIDTPLVIQWTLTLETH
ncbi:MAG TPA: YceI family protein [Kofleriaceae bacterium]